MTSRPPAEKVRRTRKSPAERRAEIVQRASEMALTDGLETLTLRSVADALGVSGGLVGHYFPSVDELLAEVFRTIAAGELEEMLADARDAGGPLEAMRHLLRQLLLEQRDRISLLWIDAWHAGRRRPALHGEVSRLMRAWTDEVAVLIDEGTSEGSFRTTDPTGSAVRIMSVVDGLSIGSAMRDALDYGPVRELVMSVSEQELGLPAGSLGPG